jgi:hypothetical protein
MQLYAYLLFVFLAFACSAPLHTYCIRYTKSILVACLPACLPACLRACLRACAPCEARKAVRTLKQVKNIGSLLYICDPLNLCSKKKTPPARVCTSSGASHRIVQPYLLRCINDFWYLYDDIHMHYRRGAKANAKVTASCLRRSALLSAERDQRAP